MCRHGSLVALMSLEPGVKARTETWDYQPGCRCFPKVGRHLLAYVSCACPSSLVSQRRRTGGSAGRAVSLLVSSPRARETLTGICFLRVSIGKVRLRHVTHRSAAGGRMDAPSDRAMQADTSFVFRADDAKIAQGRESCSRPKLQARGQMNVEDRPRHLLSLQ